MKKSIYIFSDGDLIRKDNTLRFLCEERQQYYRERVIVDYREDPFQGRHQKIRNKVTCKKIQFSPPY